MVEEFRKILGDNFLIVGDELKSRYEHIWRMEEGLLAKCVLLPRTTEQVSEIMKTCSKYQQTVVVHGGLTNLVGSTKTHKEDVVISMERMNSIIEVNENDRSMIVEAGVILEHVQNKADEYNLLFPMNFGAKGSAQLGGVISTNAGGLKVFKYGMTRNLILGLEVVMADGTVIDSMKNIIKDNSGYDLKQLFIGSEGTLGIVTKAVLRLLERPVSRYSAFVGLNKYEGVIKLLKQMDKVLGGQLCSYELIWEKTYLAMTSFPSVNKPPIPQGFKYYVLLESNGGDPQKDGEHFEESIIEAGEKGLFEDAAIAKSKSDLDWFWNIREDVHILKSQCVIDQHFDVSLSPSLIGNYVQEVQESLHIIEGVNKSFAFGHVADGNVHFIVDKQNNSDYLRKEINKVVYNPLKEIMGSVSAEHGIGFDKKAYLGISRTEEEILLMKKIKNALDPHSLLNRGKIL